MKKLPDAIATVIETSVNRYLAMDPGTLDAIEVLEGKSITLELKEFNIPVYLRVENHRLKVLTVNSQATDSVLKASIPQLIKMAVTKKDESILGSDIEMTGNMDVGREFRDLFKNVDIDWEELISKYTGDIVAHKLGYGVREFRRWLGNTDQIIKQDITEYLQEESSQLPSETEVTLFMQSVSDMRLAVERTEARIRILRNKIEQLDKNRSSVNDS